LSKQAQQEVYGFIFIKQRHDKAKQSSVEGSSETSALANHSANTIEA